MLPISIDSWVCAALLSISAGQKQIGDDPKEQVEQRSREMGRGSEKKKELKGV